MYSTQPNGAEGATINPATINPAALNSELLNPNARGIKRSRSPEHLQAGETLGDDGDAKQAKKRGRPMKSRPSISDPATTQTPIPPPQIPQAMTPQTPHSQPVSLPPHSAGGYTPATQASPPPKTTPTKTTLKALPTVRDHTTDQLNPSGDEYIPRETDEAGEKKVQLNGQLTGERKYRCRTFLVPERGDKLFMLATECARILGYRDSYLLFNKNRSLFKIIANQAEKDDLVHQEILPFSYRSRQIAIVTARSMFRQFGSRVIDNGRRVRDDYWEHKAIKQGFTEQDLAGEKRPGASKAREAAAEASNAAAPSFPGPQGEIIYANASQFGGAPQPQLMQPDLSDTRTRDYSNFIKGGPRQEITGQPYQDRTQSSPITEINQHAHQTAEFNRSLNQQRDMRTTYMHDIWRRPHEQPASSQPISTEPTLPTTRPGQSPHAAPSTMQPSGIVPNQSPQFAMTTAPYSQGLHSQTPVGQNAMRSMPQPPQQKQSRTPSIHAGSAGGMVQGSPAYNYGSTNQQMWGQPPASQTPQQHYPGYTTQTQSSQQHPQQQQQQQSSAPQMRHHSGAQPMQPNAMPYPGMQGLGQGYPAQSQGMYPPEQTTPRQFMSSNPGTSPAATQQPWSASQTSSGGSWWSNQPQ